MTLPETGQPIASTYAPPAAPLTTCLNCDAELIGPFCARCGQRRPLTDPRLREFINESTQELTHWDGKVPATILTLFRRPGLLSVDFLEGRRARWLPPLRVYLICSLAYFLSGPIVESITHRSAREVAKVTVTNADGSTTLTPEALADLEGTLFGRVFGRERIVRAVSDTDRLNRVFATAFPKAMFVLLPLFALLTRLAWRRKLPNYALHLYPALHLHSAWFGALTVSTVVIPFLEVGPILVAIQLLTWVYLIGHSLGALRRIFGDTWGRTIAKAAAIGVAYLLCLAGVSLMLLAYAVWTI